MKNKEFSKIIILTIILINILLISSINVSGAMLGINRVELRYEDVLRQGYAEKNFVVTIGTPQLVPVNFEARGEIAEWITFDKESPVLVNENNPATINVIIQPPADTRVDSYEGMILVTTGSLGQIEGQLGTNVIAAFEVKVFVDITDTQLLKCTVAGMNIKDAEIEYPLEFTATANNNGNVRIRPYFNIKILDQYQEKTILEDSFYYTSEILPTKTQTINSMLNLNLETGQYWAEIEEPYCGSRNMMTFSVLEKGGISDLVELVRVESQAWTETKEITPINVYFRNRGERIITAQFKGIISKDDKIIKIIESETINVQPGELATLNMFYQPEEPGQYKVTGRIHYNQKITYEKGTIINVNPSTKKTKKINLDPALIMFVIVIITMTTLIYFILKKTKKPKYKY